MWFFNRNRDAAFQAALLHQGNMIMATLQELSMQVAKNSTVTESAITLLQGLHEKLAEAIASNDPAELTRLADSLAAETDKLANAVAVNTLVDVSTLAATDPAPVATGA